MSEKNMTDRELLERAARAAGGKYVEVFETYGPLGDNVSKIQVEGREQNWNPLTDDGDALRLAVKLGLNIDVYRQAPFALGNPSGVEVRGYVYRRRLSLEPAADNGESLESATRRAIVRAAAAMAPEAPHE
jgi:hypothetical protein